MVFYLTKNMNIILPAADEYYDFAKANNLEIRGHNFVWHNQTAISLFNKSKEEIWELLANHIKIMYERYGDITKCWDVVNEAVEDKSSAYLRKSPWLDMFGDDYCKKVFDWHVIYYRITFSCFIMIIMNIYRKKGIRLPS